MKKIKHKEIQYKKYHYKNLFNLILDLKKDVDNGSHISCYSSNQGYYRWKCAASKKSYHIKKRRFDWRFLPKPIEQHTKNYNIYKSYDNLVSWIKENSKIIQVVNDLTAFL